MTWFLRSCAACILAVILMSWLEPGRAEDPALEVTTDTLSYCVQLHDRVVTMTRTAAVAPSQEVTDLTEEGQRMCDQGHARGGILRLRRALTLMSHTGD